MKLERGRLIWGPYNLPIAKATGHFLVTGTTGSGKTTLIDVLMRTVFEANDIDMARAIVYDPKQDFMPKLEGLGLKDKVKNLNPFAADCASWNMNKDIDDVLSAIQFASTLLPESTSASPESPFFDNACRDLISGVILTFANCVPKKTWTFRDVLLTLLYQPNMEAILGLRRTRGGQPFPLSSRLWNSYLNPKTTDERTRSNVIATLNAKLSIFEPVAESWHWAKDSFSLRDWAADFLERPNDQEQPVLVLGNEESARAAIDPINRAIFQRAVELVLARKEISEFSKSVGSDLSWFFLDEVREAGELSALNSLLTKGRSKGASVVLSFQDIDGLRAVYGQELANEIVANCNNVALLRTNSASTAEWAADMFGRFLITEADTTEGMSGGTVSSSTTRRITERSPVQPGDFLYLPLPSKENGLVGYFRDADASRSEPMFRKLDWDDLIALRPTTNYEYTPPPDGFLLTPWDQSDWERLGLEGAVPNWGEPEPSESEKPPKPPAKRKPPTWRADKQ